MSLTGQEIGKSPPSISLARMAAQLAHSRAWPHRPVEAWLPRVSRDLAFVDPVFYCGTCEYYRIIDRISAGEAP